MKEKEERGNDRHEVAGIRRRRTIGFPRAASTTGGIRLFCCFDPNEYRCHVPKTVNNSEIRK
ncbi:hypothetical protein GHT06_014613 [Daphnia sinensis]|uniref:Uncharacterized protein n=1 Tax=Daphnia sinensis TaxID=1820382 RepID=A0AAD5KQ47_9CRUS|nr:hypothetical protein GHT06_014613 [Daphnia sinensis]